MTSVNIYDIHKIIIKKFEEDYDSLESLKLLFDKDPTDHVLGKRISVIESGIDEAMYIAKSKPVLEEYDKILSTPQKISFLSKNINKQPLITTEIIKKYLSIANKYLETPIYFNMSHININCSSCDSNNIEKIDDVYICMGCNECIQELMTVSTHETNKNSNSMTNSGKRYSYIRKDHFSTSIKKFQGLQTNSIPEFVFKNITDKMHSYNIPIDKLSKDHIYEILKLIGATSYNEDVNLIYSKITNKNTCPNLNDVQDTLFRLFDIVDKIYDRLKPEDRTNAMYSQFLLYKLLKHIKFDCKDDDFYILKTRGSLIEHDNTWKKICKELEWTFEPII